MSGKALEFHVLPYANVNGHRLMVNINGENMSRFTSVLVAFLAILVSGVCSPAMAQVASPVSSALVASAGNILPVETPLYSPNHKYFLIFQGDGNLVLYAVGQPNRVVWAAGSNGGAGAYFQVDGNLVVYRNMSDYTSPVWASGTGGQQSAANVPQLRIFDDGRIVAYGASGLLFDTWADPVVFNANQIGLGRGPFMFPICITSPSLATRWMPAQTWGQAYSVYYSYGAGYGACTL
jgi:hypothetical protein